MHLQVKDLPSFMTPILGLYSFLHAGQIALNGLRELGFCYVHVGESFKLAPFMHALRGSSVSTDSPNSR